jgi:DNA-binding response OmpR family regulator/two-component sensor histidine kinase
LEKILIIEDEDLILESIKDYLQEEGYNCYTARNGTEGLQKAKGDIPDLIICDIKMPGLDGHQVLQDLRSNPQTSTIPFIFLSAMVDKNDLRKGMSLGADDYITKPFQPDDLLNAVKTRLEKYSELKKKMDVLRDSIAHALPHELQTPLVAIMGYAEMLSEKFKDSKDDEALEFSEAIHQAGVRLNRLIKNFIFYEKLELMSADPHSKAAAAGVTELTSNLIENISYKVADRFNRKDDLDIKVDTARINMPVSYFLVLVEELLDNAFKFSEPGMEVTLSCRKNEKSYEMIVKDKGRGMTEDQLANIGAYLQFEREKYEQQGMGLGLTISMKIIEFYGGKIITNSKYGEQTEIIVTVPLVQN